MSSEEVGNKISELEWVQLRQEMTEMDPDTGFTKLFRKFKDNPFVPIGAIVTCGALGYGLKYMLLGDKKNQQYMMRLRVGAQAFTIFVMAGSLYQTIKKRKNPVSQ